MALRDEETSGPLDEILSFPGWKEALVASGLAGPVMRSHRSTILGLLRVCKSVRRPLSVGLIRWHLARRGLSKAERAEERAALRWFYQGARASGGVKVSASSFVVPVRAAGAKAGQAPSTSVSEGGLGWEREEGRAGAALVPPGRMVGAVPLAAADDLGGPIGGVKGFAHAV